ncbi:hypothetical protein KXD93_19130 [Mucilaginibacter sp. BJC16-A38]|uniref:hypothetical protein n=1 Tax=Mucilaginibacter phenanthrenivorans TaxID=1234842 RepID=UPI0021572EDB|nr:hypothetical protein [Mucilaginibacter phenanthrenivorans]MCR8559772.1 hypothetical protein [Mucilaginibacter phenanthrenivorans]
MTNPLQLSLVKEDGTKRYIIIEPILEKYEKGLRNTGTYKLFKDGFGEESTLFTEPLETTDPNTDLADNLNPDYLGKITFDGQSHWHYSDGLLSLDEQKQAATCILKY